MINKSINIEYQNYKSLFYKKFDSEILPIFKSLEPERKKALIKFWVIFIPMALTFIATFIDMFIHIFLYPEDTIFHEVFVSTLCPISFFGMWVASFIEYNFTSTLKSKYVPKLLKAIGDIEWNKKGFTKQELEKSELFPLFLDKASDDWFSGIYKGSQFTIDELSLSGEGGGTVFNGVVIAIDSNKKLTIKQLLRIKIFLPQEIANCNLAYFI